MPTALRGHDSDWFGPDDMPTQSRGHGTRDYGHVMWVAQFWTRTEGRRMGRALHSLMSHIRRLAAGSAAAPASDAQLLARFVAVRDDEAFALLMHRHGPMVLAVAGRVLGDLHAAEDVFQAT